MLLTNGHIQHTGVSPPTKGVSCPALNSKSGRVPAPHTRSPTHPCRPPTQATIRAWRGTTSTSTAATTRTTTSSAALPPGGFPPNPTPPCQPNHCSSAPHACPFVCTVKYQVSPSWVDPLAGQSVKPVGRGGGGGRPPPPPPAFLYFRRCRKKWKKIKLN